MKHKSSFARLAILLIFILGVLLGLFYVFNYFIYQAKQADEAEFQTYQAALTGEYVCLKDSISPSSESEKCEPGLKTQTGEFFAIRFELMSQSLLEEVQVGKIITAKGTVIPVQFLSSDHWKNYEIEGVFSVTDSVKVVDNSEQN